MCSVDQDENEFVNWPEIDPFDQQDEGALLEQEQRGASSA